MSDLIIIIKPDKFGLILHCKFIKFICTDSEIRFSIWMGNSTSKNEKF